MRFVLFFFSLLLACGENLSKTPSNSTSNNTNGQTNAENAEPNNANNTENNITQNNEIAAEFILTNDTEEVVYTFDYSNWLTVKNAGLMAILWRSDCGFCLCPLPCAVCDLAPPRAVALEPGETRRHTWDGHRYALDGDCYAKVPAEEAVYNIEVCHFTSFQSAGESDTPDDLTCETRPFEFGDRIEFTITK